MSESRLMILPVANRPESESAPAWRQHCRSIGIIVSILSISVGGGILVLLYHLLYGTVRDQPPIVTTIYRFTSPIGALISGDYRHGLDYSVCMTRPWDHTIACITDSGDLQVIAGGARGYADGPADRAQFDGPLGLLWDATNRVLFAADRNNDRVRIVDMATAQVSSIPARFRGPHCLAPDPTSDRILVADGPLSNSTIWSATRSGNLTAVVRGLFLSDDTSRAAHRIATDRSTGLVYIAKSTEIWRLTPHSGALDRIAGPFPDLVGVVADRGVVYGFSDEAIVSVGGGRWAGFYETCPKDTGEKPLEAAANAVVVRNGAITHFADGDDVQLNLRAVVPSLCRIDHVPQ